MCELLERILANVLICRFSVPLLLVSGFRPGGALRIFDAVYHLLGLIDRTFRRSRPQFHRIFSGAGPSVTTARRSSGPGRAGERSSVGSWSAWSPSPEAPRRRSEPRAAGSTRTPRSAGGSWGARTADPPDTTATAPPPSQPSLSATRAPGRSGRARRS